MIIIICNWKKIYLAWLSHDLASNGQLCEPSFLALLCLWSAVLMPVPVRRSASAISPVTIKLLIWVLQGLAAFVIHFLLESPYAIQSTYNFRGLRSHFFRHRTLRRYVICRVSISAYLHLRARSLFSQITLLMLISSHFVCKMLVISLSVDIGSIQLTDRSIRELNYIITILITSIHQIDVYGVSLESDVATDRVVEWFEVEASVASADYEAWWIGWYLFLSAENLRILRILCILIKLFTAKH